MGSLTLPTSGAVYADAQIFNLPFALVLTNDVVFRRIPGLPVVILDDLLEP